MKRKHYRKRTRAEKISLFLDLAIVGMIIFCTLVAIPTMVNLRTLKQDLGELKTSLGDLEAQQEELRIQVDHKLEAKQKAQTQQTPVVNSGQAYKATQEEIETLAKIVYREARGIKEDSHKAAVVWCILNRVDDGYWGDNIVDVATYPNAFAWVPDTPVDEELVDLVVDVVTRWNHEKEGLSDVGRTLPKEYLYFTGDGSYNRFTKEWGSTDYWDWSLPDPYNS